MKTLENTLKKADKRMSETEEQIEGQQMYYFIVCNLNFKKMI